MVERLLVFLHLARVDEFDPIKHTASAEELSLLDRWILSDLNKLIKTARESYGGFDVAHFCAEAHQFIEALSTWYVRRSRRRFYGQDWPAEKRAAYATLYKVLTTFNRIVAPVVPFMSETIYQHLVADQIDGSAASVHHLPFPEADEDLIDEPLSAHVAATLRIMSLGRSARKESKLKVRQPLAELVVVPKDQEERQAVELFEDHFLEELNVKKVSLRENADDLITVSVEPNMKAIGAKFGRDTAAAREAVCKLDGKEGRSDAELERIRDQVAEAAIEHEKHYGTGVSPGLLWWAKQRLKPPVVRWEQQLASLTRQAVAYQEGMVDYRDDIPNPEQSVLGYGPDIPLLPALVAPVPEVMFLVDRSYSMSERELTEVAQEVPGILRTLSTPLNFGSFDTEMQAIKKVSTVKEALKLFKGGGGTDFRPIFAALKKMKSNRPSVLIIGTDGCGPAPAEPPKGVSVIWLLVGRSAEKPSIGNSETPIRWGKFIYTNPELRAVHVSAAA